MKIFDTATRSKRIFEPRNPKRVSMYVCGPTVYNYAHIGNARPAVVFDMLFRVLRHRYGADHVVYARNITDIDDKIIQKAAQEGVEAGVIATRYTDIYRADMASVGVLRPSMEPLATEHIPDMISMIARIIENGHAYVSEGHVLFDVQSYPDHGVFSKQTENKASRIDMASYKRNQEDFVLWKPSKEGEPFWSSPWGNGRPGWHIECSAMIEKNLGLPIDIHGGGIDLSFPHHENEISQGICSQGHCGHDHEHTYASYWMHNEFVNLGGKMSKSEGNVVLVHDLVKKYDGEVIRLALLTAHYRSSLEWRPDLLDTVKRRLDGYYRFVEGVEPTDIPEAFIEALEDDLDTPTALAVLSETKDKGQFLAAARFLGILNRSTKEWFQTSTNEDEIIALIAARLEARNAKDWAKADAIRKELTGMGVTLSDKPDGTDWFIS